MWQICGEKETCGTKGGLVSKWKQSMKLVVTTNGKKSAEVVVAMTMREGPNPTSVKVGGTATQCSHSKELHADNIRAKVHA